MDAFWRTEKPELAKVNVAKMTIALVHLLAFKAYALVHAKDYCVAQMLTANQKVMLDGVVVALASLKIKMANVFHVS